MKRVYAFSVCWIILLNVYASHGQDAPPCATMRVGILPSIADQNVYVIDQIRNLTNETFLGDAIQVRSKNKILPNNCYDVIMKRLKFPEEQNNIMWIYDDEVRNELAEVDVIIGEYRRSVRSYAQYHSVAYILTTPADISIEKTMLVEDVQDRAMFSAWPAWGSFFETSIQGLARQRKIRGSGQINEDTPLGRVLIVQHSSSKHKVGNELLERLIFSGMATWTKLLNVGRQRPGLVVAYEVAESLPDIAIFLYDSESEMDLLTELQLYVQVDSSSKNRKTETYFWDMAQSVSGKWRHLLNEKGASAAKYFGLRVITSGIWMPFKLGCDDITYDITPLVGGHDAIVIALTRAMDFIPSTVFNKTILLNELRVTSRVLSPGKPTDYRIPLKPLIHRGVTFKRGFKYHPSTFIGRILPKLVQANYSENDETLHYMRCDIQLEYGAFSLENLTVPEGAPGSVYVREFLASSKNKSQGIDGESMNRVVVVLEEPFAMKKEFTDGKSGNTEFEGLTIDLAKEAFDRMGRKLNRLIDYKFYVAPDNHYGSFNASTKSWNGAMGELQNGNAVMAIGMISKTILRSRFFDYSPPFEYVGLTYIRQNYRYPSTIFNFMRPFELTIWYGILTTVLLSAVFIYILEYWNPFMEKSDEEQTFDWSEVMWYSYGTMAGAGGSFAPVKLPTRLFSVLYWFFVLIITASYTGNLASFLTESFELSPAGPIEHIARLRGVKWVTLRDSYMDSFIRAGMSEEFRKLAKGMDYVDTYAAGVEHVQENINNIFIGNNLLLQHYESRSPDCAIGLSSSLVAFTELAFPMATRWRDKNVLYDVMLQMRADGTIRDTLAYWLKFKYCSGEEEDDHTMLGFDNFIGLFIILFVFVLVSFVVLAIKLVSLRQIKKNTKKEKGIEGNTDDDADIRMMPMHKENNQEVIENNV